MITESFNDVVRRYKRDYPYHLHIGSERMFHRRPDGDHASWPDWERGGRTYGFKTPEDRARFARTL